MPSSIEMITARVDQDSHDLNALHHHPDFQECPFLLSACMICQGSEKAGSAEIRSTYRRSKCRDPVDETIQFASAMCGPVATNSRG